MPKRQITFDEVLSFIITLPYAKFKEVVKQYTENTNTDFATDLEMMVSLNLQQRLEILGINNKCHKCGTLNIKKNGKKKYIQTYKCKECSTKFTLFTNTILEKTRWHWDIWIKVLEMTINSYSIDSMINVLEKDYGCEGINRKTVWLLRMKLVHALAAMPMPTLTGIIQVDETFVRECQKGSRNLINYLDKQHERKPRYGYRPSKLGVMGPEFATITTAIDNRGYCVCKVVALGKLTKEIFIDLFEKHFDNPAFICTDANDAYEGYCSLFDIPHYVKPSNYQTLIFKNGYVTPNYTNPTEAKKTEYDNKKILEMLYNNDLIDKIVNRGYMSYDEFNQLKKTNKLSLAKANELHKDIKGFINKDMTNVSTKYLQDYIGYFTYIRNWSVKNGRYPNSNKDTEQIFIEILKSKINYTITDVEEQELELPKPTNRYIKLLKEETKKARVATENKYFKFDEEDGVKTFNKREYLLDQPKSKLYAICKECKLTKYKQLALYSLVSLILKQPNIDDIIYKLLANDRHYQIAHEDLEAMESRRYLAMYASV
jgi:transposase-like protein